MRTYIGFLSILALYTATQVKSIELKNSFDFEKSFTNYKDKVASSDFVSERGQSDSITIDLDLTASEWAMFGAGILVGLSVEYSTDLENECISDGANLIVAGAHSYEYMMAYINSGEEDNLMLAYSLTYIIDGFQTLSTIDCTNIQDDVNDWLTELSSTFQPEQDDSTSPELSVQSHEDFTLPEEEDPNIPNSIYDSNGTDTNNTQTLLLFEKVYTILYDFEVIMQLIETGIITSEFIVEWQNENYYEAGYDLGEGGLGFILLLEDMTTKYQDLSQEYTSASDLEEENHDSNDDDSNDNCSFDC